MLPEAVSRVAVVVARVEVPITPNVPFDVRDEVAVIFPPVKVFMVEVKAFKILAKKFVDVAFVNDDFSREELVARTIVPVPVPVYSAAVK